MSVLYGLLPALDNPWLLNVSRMPGHDLAAGQNIPSIWGLLERALKLYGGVRSGKSLLRGARLINSETEGDARPGGGGWQALAWVVG